MDINVIVNVNIARPFSSEGFFDNPVLSFYLWDWPFRILRIMGSAAPSMMPRSRPFRHFLITLHRSQWNLGKTLQDGLSYAKKKLIDGNVQELYQFVLFVLIEVRTNLLCQPKQSFHSIFLNFLIYNTTENFQILYLASLCLSKYVEIREPSGL